MTNKKSNQQSFVLHLLQHDHFNDYLDKLRERERERADKTPDTDPKEVATTTTFTFNPGTLNLRFLVRCSETGETDIRELFQQLKFVQFVWS